jgi:hypothetical protein
MPEQLMKFEPKVRHQDAKLFYIAFGICFLMGIAGLIFGIPSTHLLSWGIIGFSGLILFILWQQNAAFDIRYELVEEGIFLKRFYLKKTISYQEIQKIRILTSIEAAAILGEKQEAEVRQRNELNFKAFKARKELNEIIKYASVPVIFSFRNSGLTILNHSVTVKGDFVLIQTIDGEYYLITPKNMEEFVDAVRQKMRVSL